jgi:hypothetical protein
MKLALDLGGRLRKRLWSHLLQNKVEQVAFLFATVVSNNGSTVFKPQDVYFLPPEDFDVQTGHHIELADNVRGRIIKRAWDTGTALVEFHSHPSDSGPAMFSGSDLAGFEEFVPHCRWRLRGRPYLAVLVNKVSVDALVWVGESKTPTALDTIRLGWIRKITPTGRTVAALRTRGARYGHGTI